MFMPAGDAQRRYAPMKRDAGRLDMEATVDKCRHGRTICVTCFRESKAAQQRPPQPPPPACICSMTVVKKGKRQLVGTDPGCLIHGRFERYEPTWAQRKGVQAKYNGLKQSY
jgi:hypothetical protein